MTERRYSDEEMARIFEEATTAPEPGRGNALFNVGEGPGPFQGLTLEELQEIGAEAGISPDAVARAAAVVAPAAGEVLGGNALSQPIPRTSTPLSIPGMPVTVRRSVELERPLSDEEWGEFVGLLRDTFAARGQVRAEGGFREWSNGNLSVALEPRYGGERLSMRSRKSNAEAAPVIGALFLAAAAVFVLDEPVNMIPLAGVFSVFGVGAIAVGLAKVRSWARLRAEQFQALAERVRAATRQAPRQADGSSSTESGHLRVPSDPEARST